MNAPSTAPPYPRAPLPPAQDLNVYVVPRGLSEEVIAVLGDYSAVGMCDPFVWVDAAESGGQSTPAQYVRMGRSEPAVLQQLLSNTRYERVRVVVLVPIDVDDSGRVPLAAEQAVEQAVRASSFGGRIVLLRLLLTTGAGATAPTGDTEAASRTVLEGWHNLLVAPEDAPAPGHGAVPWGPLADSLDVAQRMAPVVAGVSGLWAGVEGTPFDGLEVLPGITVRAVRAFYRHLDTTDIETKLRTRLFDPTGRLPLPRGGQIPVVQVEDVTAATQAMAGALWRKHRDVLRGPREVPSDTGKQAISTGGALKLFLTFIWKGLLKAPAAWWSSIVGTLGKGLAEVVQSTAFGDKEKSTFEVVSKAELAHWQDLGQQAEMLSLTIGGDTQADQFARRDLSGLWNDFVAGAMTLADGGRRAQGLEPIPVGSAVAVLPNAADAVPSRTDQFASIPTSLSAVIGLTAVEPADVLGVAVVRDRLQRTYGDPAAGVEARTAGAELDNWQRRVSRSYAWQVSSILVDYLDKARKDVAQYVNELGNPANWNADDERRLRRQQAIGVVLQTLTWSVLAIVFLTVAVAGINVLAASNPVDRWFPVNWVFVLTVLGVLYLIYVLVWLSLFLLRERDVFAELNSRQTRLSKITALQVNLKTALQDVSRLSSAYGQLLSWCRVVGPLLRAPFGPPPVVQPGPGQLYDGLPRSIQVGIADPGDEEQGDASHAIERALFPLGWLSKPWQDMVDEAAARLREEPGALFRMPGADSGSGLDQWSKAVASGQVHPTGADALWARVEGMFLANNQVNDALTRRVQIPILGVTVSAQQFGDGFLNHRLGSAAPFDQAIFTDSARTTGLQSVAEDKPAVSRNGLGYHAAVVQASEGLPPYEYKLFSVEVTIPPNNDKTTSIELPPPPPPSPPDEGMVF